MNKQQVYKSGPINVCWIDTSFPTLMVLVIYYNLPETYAKEADETIRLEAKKSIKMILQQK